MAPGHCDPAKGCVSLVELTGQLKTFIAQVTTEMSGHLEVSKIFIDGHREEARAFLLQVKECFDGVEKALERLNDGAGQFQKQRGDIDALAEKQRVHESGEAGRHAIEAIERMWIWRAIYFVSGWLIFTSGFLLYQFRADYPLWIIKAFG